MKYINIILIASALTACSPTRLLRNLDAGTPQKYIYGENNHLETNLYDTLWWQQLGDTVLNNLVDEAIVNNKDLKSMLSSIEAARLAVSVTRSSILPSVGLSLDGSDTYSHETKQKQSYGITPVMNWQINLAGSQVHSIKASKAEYEAEIENYNAALLALASEVVSTYINVLEYKKSFEIVEASYILRTASAALTDSMFFYGMSSAVDLEQSRSLQMTAAAAIPQYRRAYEQSALALAVLLGSNPIDTSRFNNTDISKLSIPSISAGIPAEIIKNRSDIRSAEMTVIASSEKVGVAWAERFPTLSLTADGGVASSTLKGLVNGSPGIWSVSASLLQPLFSFGRNKRNQEIAVINYNQSLLDYEKTVITALSEVETALSGITTYTTQVEKYNLLLQTNKYTELMSRELYKSGLNDYLYLLDAERELFSSQLSYIQLLSEQLINYVAYYKAIGIAPHFR